MAPQLSLATLQVLRAILDHSPKSLAGADIAKSTKLGSGTLYPILVRLEQSGWLESEWETIDPSTAKRPRRRYYSITALGAKVAHETFDKIAKKTSDRLIPDSNSLSKS